MKFILRLFLLSLLLIPSFSEAATYYIATTGSDSTGSGTIGAPWNKFSKAAAVMTCGDTLYVRGGTYTYDDTPRFGPTTCTAATPLIITNYPGEFPIWHPTNQGDSFINRFYISQSSGFTVPVTDVQISGLELWGMYECVKIQGTLRFVFRNNYCHGSWNNGLTGTNTGGNKDATISKNIFAANGDFHSSACVSNPTSTCNQSHGLYIMGTGWTITENLIYDNLGYGIQARAGTPSPTPNASLYGGFAGLVAHNVFAYQRNRAGVAVWAETTTFANTTFENNAFYENSQGYASSSQAYEFVGGGGYSNVTIRKSIWFATGNSVIFQRDSAGGQSTPSGVTITNTTNSDPLFKTAGSTVPGSPDFSLTATSPGIDIGFAGTGRPSYNGSAPDIGAFETFVFSSGSVENATPSKASLTFQNNTAPPLLPAASPGTFTCRKAGANDAVTATTRTGDNQIDITLTTAIVAGNAVDCSWASGNITDSALIGNLKNQPYVQTLTNQSLTNNTAGAPTFTLTQAKYRINGLRGTEAAPVASPYATAPENTNVTIRPGGSLRIRFAVTCTVADCPATGFYLYYSRNAGAYAVVPDAYGSDGIAFSGTSPDVDIPTSGTVTTNQLSTAGTFVTGALIRTSSAIPTLTIASGSKSELEYVLSFASTTVSGDTYDLRIYKQDGTVINAYTVTPRITVMSTQSGSGF